MSETNISLETMETPAPVVIKTELDNHHVESNAELTNKLKSNQNKSDSELNDKALHARFLCAVCNEHYTGQKCFFEHLQSHYLPASPEHFQCSICQKDFNAQVDFFTHAREHYKPSLMSELASSVTGNVLV
jgi:hypothetical protein